MPEETCPECGNTYEPKDLRFRHVAIATTREGFEKACDVLEAMGYTITFACEDMYDEEEDNEPE